MIFSFSFWYFCFSHLERTFVNFVTGVAGCAATLLHDAVMNPADGKIICFISVMCGLQELHII